MRHLVFFHFRQKFRHTSSQLGEVDVAMRVDKHPSRQTKVKPYFCLVLISKTGKTVLAAQGQTDKNHRQSRMSLDGNANPTQIGVCLVKRQGVASGSVRRPACPE